MQNSSQKNIIDRIAKIREAADSFIEQELCTRGITGIVPAHGVVFVFLFRQTEPVPISSLVKYSGRAKSTITGIVKTLERHGYLFRQLSAQDARSSHIGLTEKGWAIKSDFEEISLLLEQKIYGYMPLVDRERITKLLVQIEGNIAS